MRGIVRILAIVIAVAVMLIVVFNRDAMEITGLEIEPLESGTEVSFRGICTVDAYTVWVSGSRGTVLKTIDAGATWEKINPPVDSLDYRDVHALDASTAYLMSPVPAKLFKTIDAGETWTEQYHHDVEGAFFNSIGFWDDLTGMAVGDPLDGKFLVVKTTDGGVNWTQVPPENLPPAMESEANFAASGTCLITVGQNSVYYVTGGGIARVFYSHDRGETWEVSDTPMLHGISSTGIFSIDFYDADNGIIVGGDYAEDMMTKNNCAVTTDGGRTWTLVPEGSNPSGFRSCVMYIPGTSGRGVVAVGTSGTDVSLDGGLTWAHVDTTGYHTLSFTQDGSGFASGGGGRVARIVGVKD